MTKYCLVTQTIHAYAIDGEDENRHPDKLPANGRVIFTPKMERGQTINDGGETIILTPIEARITNGQIYHRGGEGIYLYAGGNNSHPTPVSYTASYHNLVAGTHQLKPRDVTFETIPGGEISLTETQQ